MVYVIQYVCPFLIMSFKVQLLFGKGLRLHFRGFLFFRTFLIQRIIIFVFILIIDACLVTLFKLFVKQEKFLWYSIGKLDVIEVFVLHEQFIQSLVLLLVQCYEVTSDFKSVLTLGFSCLDLVSTLLYVNHIFSGSLPDLLILDVLLKYLQSALHDFGDMVLTTLIMIGV